MIVLGPLLVVLAGIEVAHARGDHDEVARQAVAAGAAGVRPMLAASARAEVIAGIAAAPATPDGWELLADLARLAGRWDRSVAAPAAHAAARIARDLDADVAILHDVPDDALAARQEAWATLAARGDRWADVRVHALEVAATIARARRATAEDDPGLGYPLEVHLDDADPEVRRAACELVPQPAPPATFDPLGAAIRDDPDEAVVLACAQALCADLAWDPATPVLVALDADGAARLRAIAKAPLPAVPAGAIVDAARCLIARGEPADLAAVRALEARAPRSVRPMLRRAMLRKVKR